MIHRRHIRLDAVGGVAGDMFIAAVIDAFPDLRPGLVDAMRAAGLPPGYAVTITEHRDNALTGLHVRIAEPAERERDGARLAPPEHRTYNDIRHMLDVASLDDQVRRHAIAIFKLLADAEGSVHGAPAEEVAFHELGGWDSVADIVGAAHLIVTLSASWSVGPLPLGRGLIDSAHGRLPVPAPATALLLTGFTVLDDGLEGERVTPTGAAILRHLGASEPPDRWPRVLERTGTGFGTRALPGLSNVLRLLVFAETMSLGADEQVAEILFDVDDQTPEDLALALDRLRTHHGVLDVLQSSAIGKKGRTVAAIRIIADPASVDSIVEQCFLETTTLGVRHHVLERQVLQREQRPVVVEDRVISVKVALRPGGATAKAEAEDLRDVSGGHDARERLRLKAGGAALTDEA